MSENAPSGVYVYQPFGSQHRTHWLEGRIYGVGGLHLLARVDGLTKEEAERCAGALNATVPPAKSNGDHFIPLTGKRPCPTCGAPEGVQLRVSPTGYSVGSGFQHTPECAANFCPHGIRWSADCESCNAKRIDEGDEGEEC